MKRLRHPLRRALLAAAGALSTFGLAAAQDAPRALADASFPARVEALRDRLAELGAHDPSAAADDTTQALGYWGNCWRNCWNNWGNWNNWRNWSNWSNWSNWCNW